jgi:endo-1,4-beta-D-glucanase Y
VRGTRHPCLEAEAAVFDANSATDADTDIALALPFAPRRFSGPE